MFAWVMDERLQQMVKDAYEYAKLMKLGLVKIQGVKGRKRMCDCGKCRVCKHRMYVKAKYYENKKKKVKGVANGNI